jgi:hypothetical protein
MKLWVPPNTVSFTLSGTVSGDRIALIDPVTGEVIVNEVVDGHTTTHTVVYTQDREVIVRVRNGSNAPMVPFETYTKDKIVPIFRKWDGWV